MKSDFNTQSVGEIVRNDYRTAQVFKEHHIDFCCGGDRTVDAVCQETGIDTSTIEKEIALTLSKKTEESDPNFNHWPLDLLVDYIEKKHHRYVEATIPILKQYLHKLVSVHGEAAPYIKPIEEIFNESTGNLVRHMKKEELVLFPYIRNMMNHTLTGAPLPTPHFGSIQDPIQDMNEEHTTEGDHFKEIEKLSKNFEIPEWACNTYAVGIQLLKEFQDDLHLHIHLENNILFPKSIELERSIKEKTEA